MQHHELKNYLEFTVNKKPDKWKRKKISHTNRPEFFRKFIIKEGCQIGYQWQNANIVYISENFAVKTLLPKSLTE